MKEEKFSVLVIGGSAGSLQIVLRLLTFLKPEMNIAVVIVFHRKNSDENTLTDIMKSRTTYQVKEVEDKDELRPGVIFIAPPDYHVLVEKNMLLSLDYSEKLNYSRPSIDITFDSAAEVLMQRCSCMLLSGANADGVNGLVKAKAYGAKIIIQDPAFAEVPFMPNHGLLAVQPHLVLTEQNFEYILQKIAST